MTLSKKIIALLPIKENSDRIKGKNFKNFSGRPLFMWILETLLACPEINQIIINTDARDLLVAHSIFSSEKIIIRDRVKNLCGDDVSMNLIIEDDLNYTDGDIYIMTHVTNPLLTVGTIREALRLFIENAELSSKFDSLFTVNKVQTRFYDFNGRPINHNPDELKKTQDLDPWFEENSNLYIFTKKSFLLTQARIGKSPILYETPPLESVDIDTVSQWNYAEYLAGLAK